MLSFLHTCFKVVLTVCLALMTLGIGSVGLCAFQGLSQVTEAPFFMVIYGLVILVTIAGIRAAVGSIRNVWREPDAASDSSHHDD